MLGKVEYFLFYILVLGYLKDRKGNTWRRKMTQMYTVEVTFPGDQKHKATSNLLSLFPSAICLPPRKCLFHNLKPNNECKKPFTF